MNGSVHPYIHTYIHTYTHTYIYIHTHIYIQVLQGKLGMLAPDVMQGMKIILSSEEGETDENQLKKHKLTPKYNAKNT